AEDLAIASAESQALADQYLRIPPSNRLDVGIALIVDVVDDHADLIDVTRQHDRRFAFAVHLGEAVGGDVAADSRKFVRVFTPNYCRGAFEARRPGTVEGRLEGVDGLSAGDPRRGVC